MTGPGSRSLRSILVHLDGTPACAARLALAARIAREAKAEAWAMFVGASADHPLQLAISESPAGLLETADWAALGHARTVFDDAAAGEPALHWLDGLGTDAEHAFGRHALLADLVVMGQPDPEARAGTAPPADFIDRVLVDTGQPALVLPLGGDLHGALGRRILVGWNGTPAAAHALAAALPWLRTARHVHVLQGGPANDAEASELDVARYLAGHGVAIEMHASAQADADAGGALLALARDVSADLLVMGAFGRGRTRERLLGGATRTVLQSMHLPLLMAH